MREVIYINNENKQDEKPVEFTHYLDNDEGWSHTENSPTSFKEIIYLGKCDADGDMFCCKLGRVIHIFKGHLNSGKY